MAFSCCSQPLVAACRRGSKCSAQPRLLLRSTEMTTGDTCARLPLLAFLLTSPFRTCYPHSLHTHTLLTLTLVYYHTHLNYLKLQYGPHRTLASGHAHPRDRSRCSTSTADYSGETRDLLPAWGSPRADAHPFRLHQQCFNKAITHCDQRRSGPHLSQPVSKWSSNTVQSRRSELLQHERPVMQHVRDGDD